MKTRHAFLLCLLPAVVPAEAGAVSVVPDGNRHVEQPPVPGASASRTRALRTTYDQKYRKIFALLKNDGALRAKINQVSAEYGIDAMHMVGAIVGEHTYNVDAYDRLQTYYVKAVSYLNSNFAFTYEGESVDEFISRPEFEICRVITGSYTYWSCNERVWNEVFRGKSIDGKTWPDNRLSAVFFQPYYAGQTFGIGQLNPLTALRMSDLVNEVSGLPKLDHRDAQQVYRTIMDPDLTLPYVAATLKRAIDSYRGIAGFDISTNPGLTATLYNVGDAEDRARRLAAENRQRAANGQEPKLPEENYYGWLVNDRLEELRALF
jgi:hypothetical protein